MPSQETGPAAFNTQVRAALIADDRSVAWLAKRAGIPDSTLRFQLDRPDRLTVENWLRIGAALGWSADALVRNTNPLTTEARS